MSFSQYNVKLENSTFQLLLFKFVVVILQLTSGAPPAGGLKPKPCTLKNVGCFNPGLNQHWTNSTLSS